MRFAARRRRGHGRRTAEEWIRASVWVRASARRREGCRRVPEGRDDRLARRREKFNRRGSNTRRFARVHLAKLVRQHEVRVERPIATRVARLLEPPRLGRGRLGLGESRRARPGAGQTSNGGARPTPRRRQGASFARGGGGGGGGGGGFASVATAAGCAARLAGGFRGGAFRGALGGGGFVEDLADGFRAVGTYPRDVAGFGRAVRRRGADGSVVGWTLGGGGEGVAHASGGRRARLALVVFAAEQDV